LVAPGQFNHSVSVPHTNEEGDEKVVCQHRRFQPRSVVGVARLSLPVRGPARKRGREKISLED
jgi:hypothetical protein